MPKKSTKTARNNYSSVSPILEDHLKELRKDKARSKRVVRKPTKKSEKFYEEKRKAFSPKVKKTLADLEKYRLSSRNVIPEKSSAKKTGGVKNDEGKLPLGLIPKEAIDALGRGLKYGAIKYAKHNWAKGMDWSRVYDAVLRHFFAWISGEGIDKESKLSHIDLALCGLAFLAAYEARGTGNDDRYKP